MFKVLYCLLFCAIQYGNISGQSQDAQQINQHFYSNIQKLISNKYDNKAESEVIFFHLIFSVNCKDPTNTFLFKEFTPSCSKCIGKTTTTKRNNELAE